MYTTTDISRAMGRLLAVGILLLTAKPAMAESPEPVRIVFDTDMGNDVDDAMALAVIHALQSRGECELLAVTLTKDNPYAAPCVDLLNTFYRRGDIPIGVVHDGVTRQDGKYIRRLTTAEDAGQKRYPHDLTSGRDAPEAVGLLRKTLAGQADGSVVVVQVGFSTNLARLLDSPADDVSPLDGIALVRRKVRLLSIMAGAYTEELQRRHFKEYNIVQDVASARALLHRWPTPIVASGWEIGNAIQHPAASMREDYGYVAHHPLREAYDYYRGLANNQPTFDLTSVLYAVRPQRNYFTLSPPGRLVVEDDGFTRFNAQPDGPHRFMSVTPAQIATVREALAMLCSQPPEGR
ncbi:MAG: nucleoside hydrolase [Planctomycetes bacterium]|nr:nucleoside hydrolase [Planctomycetota bacterium]